MKILKYMAALVLAAVVPAACVDMDEMNTDPNNASTTSPALLLTSMAYHAFSESSTSPNFAKKMMVRTDNENDYQTYKWTRGSFGYYSRLRDVQKLCEEAAPTSAYQGVARLFRAHYFFMLTMNFGDIPYSEALGAEHEANYTPAYDTQEAVMAGILKELDDADALLAGAKDAITGDIIYGGDLMKWRRLVNAYRLRVLTTLSAKTRVGEYNVREELAKTAARPLMQSGDDNGQLVFLDQQDNRYTFFNDSDFGSGHYMSGWFVRLLADRHDARLFAFATKTPNAEKAGLADGDFSAYDGGDPDAPYLDGAAKAVRGECSKPLPRFYQSPTNEPMILLGYTEQQLCLAEAAAKGWIAADERALYESAVRASYQFYARYCPEAAPLLDADAYLREALVSYDPAAPLAERLARIAMQKFVPTFLQGSMWLPYYEALRTGTPALHTPDGKAPLQRWMYPQDEYNNNAANVQAAVERQYPGGDMTTETPWWRK